MKRALIMAQPDNVAVALTLLQPGEPLVLAGARQDEGIVPVEPVEFGHKLAVQPIPAGGPVRKYGEVIGYATADIAAGAHVHVHNMVSARARGASRKATR